MTVRRRRTLLPTQKRSAQAAVLGAEVTHPAVTFGANVAAILGGDKFGRYSDIAAAEVMQQSLVHEMCSPTAGANLAHVKVMAVAFGAETDYLEEAFFEIVAPSEDAEVSLERHPRAQSTYSRAWRAAQRPGLSSLQPADLAQKV